MKYFVSLVSGAVALTFLLTFGGEATRRVVAARGNIVSPNLVVSQFQAGGASSANDEFIEILNTSANAVDLNGHRLVYRSASGTNDVQIVEWTTSTIVPPGGYYLIASTSYDGGVSANITYNNATCSCALSATSGGLAIRFGAVNSGVILDSVGWGSATNIFVENTNTPAAGNDNSKARSNNGCQDTDNNNSDFGTLTPSAPRNAGTPPASCGGGGGGVILANGAASPNTVAPGANTLLTVSVLPATNPPSTGITVTGNLTNIGGSAGQQFFDNGTNGDQTGGDNVFSYLATVPIGTGGGPTTVSAVAADVQVRSVNVTINLTIDAPPAGEDPLLLGNPSNAVTDTSNENNYLMNKAQYSLSYNRASATPNWVAWRLDSSWIGSAPRQDDYRPDPALPAGWYQVQDNDYSGSGYDRGHMCPSGDRTRSITDNSATFLMTNFVPQLAANNQGPWNDFENYLRTLAGQGNEIYIFSGGHGNSGTIAAGRIVIPTVTWKVVLVLPNGSNDLERVGKATRTIAIVVPNQPPVSTSAPWRQFRTTVKAVEALTGHNFFSKVSKNTQEIIERRRDTL
jgi:endonuclease G